MSNPGSWGRSWLNSWMSSWGRKEETGRSGWFRLWLAKLQQESLDAQDKTLETKKQTVEEKQGSMVVPKIIRASSAKKKRVKRSDSQFPQHLASSAVVLSPRIPQLLDQPLPDYSVSVFQKAIDFQKHQQFQKQKRQREEETLILLLAA